MDRASSDKGLRSVTQMKRGGSLEPSSSEDFRPGGTLVGENQRCGGLLEAFGLRLQRIEAPGNRFQLVDVGVALSLCSVTVVPWRSRATSRLEPTARRSLRGPAAVCAWEILLSDQLCGRTLISMGVLPTKRGACHDLAEHMGASGPWAAICSLATVTLRSELKCSIGICSFSLKNSIIYGR